MTKVHLFALVKFNGALKFSIIYSAQYCVLFTDSLRA